MSDIVIHKAEHESFDVAADSALSDLLKRNDYNPDDPNLCLGLDWDDRARTKAKASYYVGLKWLREGANAIYVEPKIPNLDFMSMFIHCFDSECAEIATKLGKIYDVDFDKKLIAAESEEITLTPLLIIHFLKRTERIVKRGLKSNFVYKEENLNSKIKGKLLLGQTIRRNFAAGRNDRTMCRYQDYCVDCTENRILKQALLFACRYISNKGISCRKDLKNICTFCLGAFVGVADNISQQQIKNLKVNPLFQDYADALKVAKLILRRFSYNIDLINNDCDRLLPPFWINMSLLFELYVYSQLKINYRNQIGYHLRTYGNEIDFVKYDENLIIDTKYIPHWAERDNHDNIRQLSGYARNHRLRKQIMIDAVDETTILPCLIIYPGKTNAVTFDTPNVLDKAEMIDAYLKFHKLAIELPLR